MTTKTVYRYYIFLTIFFVATHLAAFAQFSQQKFITYTTADGLTDNYVMKIATDKKGFTWVATRNGISRFDGLTFTNYKGSHGLRSSWVTDVVVDNNGTVWVSTEWGLCYYNEAADQFVYLNAMNEVVVLYTGPLYLQGDVLWMAAESGLLKVDVKTKKYAFVSTTPIPDPQCIATDARGAIWVGTRGHGFYVWQNNRLLQVHHPALPADAHLMDFYRDSDGFWCATSEGLLKLESNTVGHLYHTGPANTTVDALTFVSYYPPLGDSMLLCGTYHKRIAFFNKRQQRFTDVFTGSSAQVYGLPDAIIHDGAVANDLLWIGSDKGLTLLNNRQQDYTTYLLNGNAETQRALVKKVFAVPQQPHKRWLVLNNPGSMVLYNSALNQIEKQWPAPPGRFYEAALPTADGRFFLVHRKGIDRFAAGTGITTLHTEKKQRFYSACLDSTGNLWVGTGDGLMRYNPSTKTNDYIPCRFNGTTVENNSFSETFLAKDVAADASGHIWIASNKYGLFCFDVAMQSLTPYRQPSAAAYETKNRCGSLALDAKGWLWIGNAAGLSLFHTKSRTFITHFNRSKGLESSYVYGLAMDASRKVVGRGNSGVFSVDASDSTIANYPVPVRMSASLLDQEVSFVNGEAVVGFEGGFSIYRQHRSTPFAPRVFITALYAGDKRLLGGFSLNHEENNLRIDYTAVQYTYPEAVRFRYRLSGNSNQWIDAGTQRSVQLTQLSPGDYRFEVVAETADKYRSQPAVLQFTIQPPFWKTVWFRMLVSLAVAASAVLFIRYRIRAAGAAQAQRQQQQQLELEQYQQQLELEKISSFFSRSLMDKNTSAEVLDDVARNLIGELDFENCMVYMWDDERQQLLQQAGVGRRGLLHGKPNLERYNLAKGEGIVGATMDSGAPVLVNDTDKDPRYVTKDGECCGSELCVPLLQNGEVVGAINVEQSQKGYFGPRHLQTLTTIATLTAQKLKALEQAQTIHQKQLELSQASRKLFETELSLLRNQMNPHFIFNSLNSIQKYIWESRQEDAAEYLTKFARLMRAILENSAQQFVPLQKEVAALKLYLELEHRRSNQKFDYHLSVDESLDTRAVQIPPLLLQPYIENAIWHGLNTKAEHGQLTVSIHAEGEQLICLIDDNGIGRQASQQLKREGHVSMGLNISHQRVQLLHQQTGVAANVVVTDKTQGNGEAAGTCITISLPLIQHHA